jgi:2-oxoglutarate ferredoxin oxidoreductase subunit delta
MSMVKDKVKKIKEDKIITQVPKGSLVLDKTRCKSCGYCIYFCSKNVLAFSEEFNKKGYRLPCAKNPQDCIGCNFCGLYCPDLALFFSKDSRDENNR